MPSCAKLTHNNMTMHAHPQCVCHMILRIVIFGLLTFVMRVLVVLLYTILVPSLLFKYNKDAFLCSGV